MIHLDKIKKINYLVKTRELLIHLST